METTVAAACVRVLTSSFFFTRSIWKCTVVCEMPRNLADIGVGFALQHPSKALGLAGRQQHGSGTSLALTTQFPTALVGEQGCHLQGIALESVVNRMVGDTGAKAEIASGMVDRDRDGVDNA